MDKTILKGWKSSFYEQRTTENWYFLFYERHGRAADLLNDYCGFTAILVARMAQFSQVAWNLYKDTVRLLEKHIFDKNFPENQTKEQLCHCIKTTTQLLAFRIANWVKNYEDEYPTEAKYLTQCYKKILQ